MFSPSFLPPFPFLPFLLSSSLSSLDGRGLVRKSGRMKNLRRSVRKWTFVLPRPRIALGEKFESRFDCPSRYNQCHHLSLLTKVACEEEDGEANSQGSRLPKNNTPLSLFMKPNDLKLKNIFNMKKITVGNGKNRTLMMVLNNTCWRRARCRGSSKGRFCERRCNAARRGTKILIVNFH